MQSDRLQIKVFHIKSVEMGAKTKVESGQLFLNPEIEFDKNIFEKVEVKIIKPGEHNIYVNTIMDVVPISTKVLCMNLGLQKEF